MSTHTVRFLDPARAVVATATVADAGGHFAGTVDLTATPAAVRAVFDEYEEVVLGQMFSFLDEVQAKVAALGLRAEVDGRFAAPVKDLQVYPTSGELSFQFAVVPTPA
jgi:hypothetical protein